MTFIISNHPYEQRKTTWNLCNVRKRDQWRRSTTACSVAASAMRASEFDTNHSRLCWKPVVLRWNFGVPDGGEPECGVRATIEDAIAEAEGGSHTPGRHGPSGGCRFSWDAIGHLCSPLRYLRTLSHRPCGSRGSAYGFIRCTESTRSWRTGRRLQSSSETIQGWLTNPGHNYGIVCDLVAVIDTKLGGTDGMVGKEHAPDALASTP